MAKRAEKAIRITGAAEHNLKNISLSIPRDKMVVITGISGSGKSSLAFDTVYAEGRRKYVESLSAYARQFLERMEKPDVEYIDGLSPAISIEQKNVSKNPRSTVGTVTAGSTDGLSCTTGAMSVATIAGLSTIYFRTGANAGTYRVLDSASATSHTWDTPTYADVEVGDTAVAVNVLPFGLSRVQLLATYMTCFDIDEACTSDYFGIDVVRLNLAEQYKEYVEFMWNPCNWMPSTSGRVDQYTT